LRVGGADPYNLVMPPPKLWPGQVEKAFFTLEQVRALSSAVRAEVLWAFSSVEPRSTNEVAEAIQRTAPTVRYHVNELLKADLLIVAETRKKRSRTEEAYVHKISWGYTPKPPFEKEYMAQMHRGLSSIFKAMDKERAMALVTSNEETSYYDNTAFQHTFVRISPAKIALIRQKIFDLVDILVDEDDEHGVAVHIAGFMAPVVMESRRKYKSLTGRELDLADREDEENS